jgi:hypothetical protein
MQDCLPGRSALVIAHPGHELKVFGWVTCERPEVHILTDGSGHSGCSRLDSSRAVIASASAVVGCIFGRLTDREFYEAILAGDFGLFERLVAELAKTFIENGVTRVAGDAVEGYNPAHDICRLVVDAAVGLARRHHDIANYDFPVVASRLPDDGSESLTTVLDDATLELKIRTALAYRELRSEVESALETSGAESFRTEQFRRRCETATLVPPGDPPFYETYGEQQVEIGRYRHVLRYQSHVLPLNEAISSYAGLRADRYAWPV